MRRIVERVAQKMSLPCWWVEAVAIEYAECREYATREEIWTFDFDRLSERDLKKAVRSHRVVVHGTLIHNVLPEVVASRTAELLASKIPASFAEEPGDIIPEGLASDYCFPFSGNPIDVWDPKLNFSSHFQVLDDGHFWQWHIAKFEPVKGRNYGKWVSSEIDLEPLGQIRQRLALLRNPVIKPGERGHAEFKFKVKQFYEWLNELRRPILSRLEQIHATKRPSQAGFPKAVEGDPLQLSRFETFTVREREIYTKFFVELVFFRGCREHAAKAEKLAASAKDNQGIVVKLDQIYQQRASAVILAVACFEAFINGLGFEHFPKLWGNLESLPLIAKWQLYLTLKGKGDRFDPGREPYQSLSQLVKGRNSFIHFKRQYKKVCRIRNKVTTYLQADLPREFICDLPARLERLIRELCENTDLPTPPWLTPKKGQMP